MNAKKIILTIGIAFSIFLITLSLVSYKFLKNAIKVEAFNHLVSARELLKSQVEGYFHDRFGDIDVLASNPVTGQGFARLSKAFHASGLDSPQYTKIAELYQPLMEHYLTDYGYVNIYFVDKDGDVMFSAIREEFTGTNLLTGRFKQFSIGQVFARGLDLDGVAFAAVNTVERRVTILGSLIGSITILFVYLVNRKRKQQIISDSLLESEGYD